MPARRVTALLAAAGKGSRLGAPIPKAFVSLRGVSLMERSIRGMVTSDVVDQIIVLVSPDMEDYARELFAKRGVFELGVGIRLVHGGGERADSVWAGLQAIEEDDGIVLIHDSARALTPPEVIERVITALREGHEAVIPVLPVTVCWMPSKTLPMIPIRSGRGSSSMGNRRGGYALATTG